jgi:RIO kinase 1
VTFHHPNSEEFLDRDCRNVANLFHRQGVDTGPDELLTYVHDHADPESDS